MRDSTELGNRCADAINSHWIYSWHWPEGAGRWRKIERNARAELERIDEELERLEGRKTRIICLLPEIMERVSDA